MPNPTGINQYTKGGRSPQPPHSETMKAVAGHSIPGVTTPGSQNALLRAHAEATARYFAKVARKGQPSLLEARFGIKPTPTIAPKKNPWSRGRLIGQ